MKPPRFVCWLVVLTCIGCQDLNVRSMMPADLFAKLRSQSPDDDEERDSTDDFETKVETPLLGEYVVVAGLNMIVLEGVGLVTGLNGTGGDPPPSMYRTALLEDMKKRSVRNPNQILRSPNTALVAVRAYLPPLVQRGDHFDIEVRVPGEDDTTSLNGGWLLETVLAEQAFVPGRGVLKGHVFAKAKGPILISTGEGDESSLAGVLKRGRILGGGTSVKDRDMSLFLRNDFRSVRNAKRVVDRIGKRFHHYNKHGLKEPLAETTFSDQKIVLKIQPRYKENFPRYLQVIRNIAFRETSVAQRVRMENLKEQLNTPATSQKAALQLEAIGSESIPILKSGLKNTAFEVRFHAAAALAYLEDGAGLRVLAEAARDEPAFRVFALAAMSTVDTAESHMLLRDLMNESGRDLNAIYGGKSAETRYGAIRALTTMDPYDPFVRGEKMNDQFRLHVLDTKGEPMVHLTHYRKSEIVLFGADQKFHTPLVLRAGKSILITSSPGSGTIVVSRYQVGRPDKRKVVSSKIADVIRTVAEFGATYPDVAQMLVQAENQQNLFGRFDIDALPTAGRTYYRPTGDEPSSSRSKTRVGREHLAPNLFDSGRRSKQNVRQPKLDEHDAPGSGTASLADVSTGNDTEIDFEKPKKRFSFLNPFRFNKLKQEEPDAE